MPLATRPCGQSDPPINQPPLRQTSKLLLKLESDHSITRSSEAAPRSLIWDPIVPFVGTGENPSIESRKRRTPKFSRVSSTFNRTSDGHLVQGCEGPVTATRIENRVTELAR